MSKNSGVGLSRNDPNSNAFFRVHHALVVRSHTEICREEAWRGRQLARGAQSGEGGVRRVLALVELPTRTQHTGPKTFVFLRFVQPPRTGPHVTPASVEPRAANVLANLFSPLATACKRQTCTVALARERRERVCGGNAGGIQYA